MIQTHPPNTLSIPLTSSMLETALEFATEQLTLEKRKQVFNNTLAVQVVHKYMRMLGVPSALSSSDTWNPFLRQFTDMADLQLVNIGHIECRAVDLQTLNCILPADLPTSRVGVIPVKLDYTENQAQLLGFSQSITPGAEITPNRLQPLDELIDYLKSSSTSLTVQLRQWLEGQFDEGWQRAETLVGNQRFSLARGFMSDPIQLQVPSSGAKLIDLGMEIGNQSVVLLLGISPIENETIEIRVQLHPTQDEQHLPSNLQLELVSDSGETLRSVKTRQFDNLIQLPRFQCHAGEQFGIQISNDEIQITETFMV